MISSITTCNSRKKIEDLYGCRTRQRVKSSAARSFAPANFAQPSAPDDLPPGRSGVDWAEGFLGLKLACEMGCHDPCHFYTATVKMISKLFRFSVLLVLVAAGMGCSGINTTQSVNPAMFFLPGFGQVVPEQLEPLALPLPESEQELTALR
jgi:hypothetical protein